MERKKILQISAQITYGHFHRLRVCLRRRSLVEFQSESEGCIETAVNARNIPVLSLYLKIFSNGWDVLENILLFITILAFI